jgi:ketosteroid isomerase-like protein/GNAT superfamily N-acetyltransferase
VDDSRVGVRAATHADVGPVATMVAAAFAADPAWSFMIPSDREDAREAFARSLLVPRIRRGTAWVTDDCTAVAMWDRRAVDGNADADHDEWWATFRADAGEEVWARIQAYDAALEAVAPPEPFWYLGVLATHPDHQGQGLASAVLAPGLAAADAESWDCWLETSTPANKAFYTGRGFTESVAVDIPGGPATWWLRRPGRGSVEHAIRAAERRLAHALADPDPTAWVYEYTEDAVFDGGGHAVQGRAALLEMAAAMQPLSDVSIRPLRTEASADLATVWCEASWVSGPPESRSRTDVRGMILWRKDIDGQWRVACEHIG